MQINNGVDEVIEQMKWMIKEYNFQPEVMNSGRIENEELLCILAGIAVMAYNHGIYPTDLYMKNLMDDRKTRNHLVHIERKRDIINTKLVINQIIEVYGNKPKEKEKSRNNNNRNINSLFDWDKLK